jgi:hypothetical protein
MPPASFSVVGNLKEEQSFQDFTVRIYEEDSVCCCGDSLEILFEGQRIYAVRGFLRLWIGRFWDQESKEQRIPLGQDITGDGIPNLVITNWSGGAHCCTYYHIFSLHPELQHIGMIDAGHYDSRIEDLDGDGNWEFMVHDWAYRFWCEACSPGPYVVLHYTDDGFRIVPEFIRKPAPTTEELEGLAQTFRKRDYPFWSLEDFWEVNLSLVYTGHAELVNPFLDMVCPEGSTCKEEFLDDFLPSLQQSLYWPEIKHLSEEWPWPDS